MSTRLPLYRNPLHQLVAGSTWRAAWFLLAYLVWGWLLWTAVFAATLTAAVLCITLAGIPLLIAAAGVIRGCANAERWRLREVLAEPVHGGYRAVRRPGILGQVRTRWTDPATWRDFAYLVVLFPLLWALDLAVIVVWLVLLGRDHRAALVLGPGGHVQQRAVRARPPVRLLPERAERARVLGLVRRQPAPGADRRRRSSWCCSCCSTTCWWAPPGCTPGSRARCCARQPTRWPKRRRC